MDYFRSRQQNPEFRFPLVWQRMLSPDSQKVLIFVYIFLPEMLAMLPFSEEPVYIWLFVFLIIIQPILLIFPLGLIPAVGVGLAIGNALAMLELHWLRPHRKWTKWLVQLLLFLFGLADIVLGFAFSYAADWLAKHYLDIKPWQNIFVYGGLIQCVSGAYRMSLALFCGRRNRLAMCVACHLMLLSCLSYAAPVLGLPSYFMIEYEFLKRFLEPEMEAEAEAKAKAEAVELERRTEEQTETGGSETGSESNASTSTLCYEEDDGIPPEGNWALEMKMGNLNQDNNV